MRRCIVISSNCVMEDWGKYLGDATMATTIQADLSTAAQCWRHKGYDYTYLFPGLRKVVQAAGKVIRTEDDQGSVFLIDDRFHRAEVRALLPKWWRVPS